MVYSKSTKLPPHPLTVTSGKFPVGHSDVGIRGVNQGELAIFTTSKIDLSNCREFLIEGVGQMKGDRFVFMGERRKGLAQIGVHEVGDEEDK